MTGSLERTCLYFELCLRSVPVSREPKVNLICPSRDLRLWDGFHFASVVPVDEGGENVRSVKDPGRGDGKTIRDKFTVCDFKDQQNY